MQMTSEHISGMLRECAEKTTAYLDAVLPDADPALSAIVRPMRYSLLAGGKRIRPFLVQSFAALSGGEQDTALAFSAALEMVHTYSLIHDDLPCMDDDDLRRGMPTNHKVFGEATAVLAGDALLTEAFRMLTLPTLRGETLGCAVRLLSEAAGYRGMVGGQIMDLAAEHRRITREELLRLHACKTGALIRAACLLGCLCSPEPDEALQQAADRYAASVGLVFQIVDDLLDVEGTAARLGKTPGKDAASGKTTFLTFDTPGQARDEARRLTDEAVCAIAPYDREGTLAAFAFYLLERDC